LAWESGWVGCFEGSWGFGWLVGPYFVVVGCSLNLVVMHFSVQQLKKGPITRAAGFDDQGSRCRMCLVVWSWL